MLNQNNYHGFARFAVWCARLTACWVHVLDEMYAQGTTFGDIWFRCEQEWAIANGMSVADATKWGGQYLAERA